MKNLNTCVGFLLLIETDTSVDYEKLMFFIFFIILFENKLHAKMLVEGNTGLSTYLSF